MIGLFLKTKRRGIDYRVRSLRKFEKAFFELGLKLNRRVPQKYKGQFRDFYSKHIMGYDEVKFKDEKFKERILSDLNSVGKKVFKRDLLNFEKLNLNLDEYEIGDELKYFKNLITLSLVSEEGRAFDLNKLSKNRGIKNIDFENIKGLDFTSINNGLQKIVLDKCEGENLDISKNVFLHIVDIRNSKIRDLKTEVENLVKKNDINLNISINDNNMGYSIEELDELNNKNRRGIIFETPVDDKKIEFESSTLVEMFEAKNKFSEVGRLAELDLRGKKLSNKELKLINREIEEFRMLNTILIDEEILNEMNEETTFGRVNIKMSKEDILKNRDIIENLGAVFTFDNEGELEKYDFNMKNGGEIRIKNPRIITEGFANLNLNNDFVAKIEEIEEEYVKEGMTVEEKIAAIIKGITDNTSYNREELALRMTTGDKYLDPNVHNPYGLIISNGIVCSGVSKLFNLMCERQGYEAEYISHDSLKAIGHATSEVIIDGRVKRFDISRELEVEEDESLGKYSFVDAEEPERDVDKHNDEVAKLFMAVEDYIKDKDEKKEEFEIKTDEKGKKIEQGVGD
ncbi:MAG: hypothetical protein N4A47_04625 [Clostridia bacterium]|jgi:hypothetical protein|nr:hypothetical protein [Clostridia bacterium]